MTVLQQVSFYGTAQVCLTVCAMNCGWKSLSESEASIDTQETILLSIPAKVLPGYFYLAFGRPNYTVN